MQLLSKYDILTKEIRNDCLLSALMYNNRRLLEKMLKFLYLNGSNENKFISQCCMVLQNRENCTKLLHHRRVIRPVSMSKVEHIYTIFTLFGIFYNDFKNELNSLLESAPGIQQGFIKVSLLNQIPSFRFYDHDIFVAHLVLSIIELGKTETLIHDAKFIVPQLREMLLNYSRYSLRIRHAVELLIHENVEIDTEKVIMRDDSNFPLGLRRGRLYHYSRLSLTQLCITQYYHLSRPDGPVPVFSPIYYCNSTTFISTTAKSIKLITRYEKRVPLINFSVFYNA